ncbi:MAG: hypothetical protein Ct9H300mP1_32370 [Planctomycetaceae bacterium]|nr:MAG: hypothetical protein Ct9H300mP1_32370 [Planctomycetaceae bacterium]
MPRRRRRIEKWLWARVGDPRLRSRHRPRRRMVQFRLRTPDPGGRPRKLSGGDAITAANSRRAPSTPWLPASARPPELDQHPEGPVPIQVSCRDGRSLPRLLHVFPSPTTRTVRTASWGSCSLCNQPNPPSKPPPTDSTPNWPRCDIRFVNGSVSTRCWARPSHDTGPRTGPVGECDTCGCLPDR